MANVTEKCRMLGCPFNLPEGHTIGDHPFPTDDRGIYPKYVVFKHPKVEVKQFGGAYTEVGSHQAYPMEQVKDFVFVLKPLKDKAARVAMAAYAEEIFDEKPQLARDIWEILGDFH